MPIVFGSRGTTAAACLVIAACAPQPVADPPVVVEVGSPLDAPASTSPAGTLRQAARMLDTLYASPPDGPAAAIPVMEALREIRNGRMDTALERLVPVASDTGSEGDVAREILGELLFHHDAWAALADSPGEASSLFAAFALAQPEEWVFIATSAELPLEVTAVGTPLILARVNGVARKFWVDTGAGLTVLSSELAALADVGVDEPAASAGTATGRRVAARPAVLAELDLGPVLVRNHRAIVIDAADLRLQAPELPGDIVIDGILGWPLIRNLDLTLDFAGERIVIREPSPRPDTVRNLFWLGYPAVAARTENGRPLLFGLDTGAASSSVSPHFLEAAGVRSDGTRSRRIGSAGGFEITEVEILDSAVVRVDQWRLRLRDIDVHDVEVTQTLDLAGVLGSDIAAQRALRIDFRNGRLDFLRPGEDR